MTSNVGQCVVQFLLVFVLTVGLYYEAWPVWLSFLTLGVMVSMNNVLHVLLREAVRCLGELVREIGGFGGR